MITSSQITSNTAQPGPFSHVIQMLNTCQSQVVDREAVTFDRSVIDDVTVEAASKFIGKYLSYLIYHPSWKVNPDSTVCTARESVFETTLEQNGAVYIYTVAKSLLLTMKRELRLREIECIEGLVYLCRFLKKSRNDFVINYQTFAMTFTVAMMFAYKLNQDAARVNLHWQSVFRVNLHDLSSSEQYFVSMLGCDASINAKALAKAIDIIASY